MSKQFGVTCDKEMESYIKILIYPHVLSQQSSAKSPINTHVIMPV